MKRRDREVRAHEAAHKRAGGNLASSPNYQFSRGPDNIQYAVAGEVSIDTKPVDGNPQKTIEKMETVRKAALAPANPSSQDRRVAAQAEAVIRQARSELNEQREAERAADIDDKKEVENSQEDRPINNLNEDQEKGFELASANRSNPNDANGFGGNNEQSFDQGLTLARQQNEAYGNFGLNNRAQNPGSFNNIDDDDRRARPQSINLNI